MPVRYAAGAASSVCAECTAEVRSGQARLGLVKEQSSFYGPVDVGRLGDLGRSGQACGHVRKRQFTKIKTVKYRYWGSEAITGSWF